MTELEAARNLLEHIMDQLRQVGYDCEDPIEIPDAISDLIEKAGLDDLA